MGVWDWIQNTGARQVVAQESSVFLLGDGATWKIWLVGVAGIMHRNENEEMKMKEWGKVLINSICSSVIPLSSTGPTVGA